MRSVRWGGIAALAMAGLCGVLLGVPAARAALVMGGVALGLQLLGERLVRRTGQRPTVDNLAVYAIGFGLRVVGIVVLGILVTVRRELFPPVPSAVGYLGTVIPLLYLETRRRR